MMGASPTRPPASLNREVGELRVRLEAVEDEMRILRADVREFATPSSRSRAAGGCWPASSRSQRRWAAFSPEFSMNF